MEFATDIQVLSTPGCAGCDDVKRVIAAAFQDPSALTWEEIDLAEYPEVAGRFGVMTVPRWSSAGRSFSRGYRDMESSKPRSRPTSEGSPDDRCYHARRRGDVLLGL